MFFMCGINGIVFQKGINRDTAMLNQIRFLFDELMVETQSRGEHATGIVAFKRDGSYAFHKAAVNAVEITTRDEKFRGIVNGFDNDSSIVIAHTRYYTKGKPDNNLNNHPFDIGGIVGVHNGTVANDDQLFKDNKDNFTRMAEVDSEIVYQLINHHNPNRITLEGLKTALEKTYLRGLFALAFAHKNDPNRVHIVKQEKPMSLAYWEEAGLVIFNSEDTLIKNAFSKLRRAGLRWGFDTNLTVKYLTLKDDTYVTINANAEKEENLVSARKKLFILSSATKNYYNNGRGAASTGTSATSCGTGTTGSAKTSCGTGNNFRSVTATDSIGRVIEGELDVESGEVIIYTPSQITNVGSNDDGHGAEQAAIEAIDCTECGQELGDDEIEASYNEGAENDKSYVCKTCYQKALDSVMHTSQTV